MSTEERYGSEVWQGIVGLQARHERGEGPMWVSAVAVGESAGVSTMTARKYLNKLVSMGRVHVLNVGSAKYYMVSAYQEYK